MAISRLAGRPAPKEILFRFGSARTRYFEPRPDPGDAGQLVSFGTSGHRGSPLRGSFTETHILAITGAICDYRRAQGTDGPLYVGKDTPALSGPTQCTALGVLVANEVQTIIQRDSGFMPTPGISRWILVYNRPRTEHLAENIVVTPSHDPQEDGGFKYDATNEGPADTDVRPWVEKRANELMRNGNTGVKRVGFGAALKAGTTRQEDFLLLYVRDLRCVMDMDAIRAAGLKLAVDAPGGAAVHYWEPINAVYEPDIGVVNPKVDPAFSFMTVDHDGEIRTACSTSYAMAGLVGLKHRRRIAFANDPNCDRLSIVTPATGLMNLNHYLTVAIFYLLTHRPDWPAQAAIGKTLVSSNMNHRVVCKLGRRLSEVPVGFKWFAAGLFDRSYCFGGEESAGASFLRRDGSAWTTDKDRPIINLLAAEIDAHTGKDPREHYRALTEELGTVHCLRIDAPGTQQQKARLTRLSPGAIKEPELAGKAIVGKLTRAPGNGAPIEELKVVPRNDWFAARRLETESFKDEQHLQTIITEAQHIVRNALGGAG